jgi:hypothetical protein
MASWRSAEVRAYGVALLTRDEETDLLIVGRTHDGRLMVSIVSFEIART